MLLTIPDWNSQGLIAPVDFQNPVSPNRSPYAVSLPEVVRRFAITPERVEILRGFLDYRAALHTAGLTQGFQWLDGSFLEDKETTMGVAPGDIDVATFFVLPTGTTQAEIAARDPLVFGPDGQARKDRFHVDAYLLSLEATPQRLVANSVYWSSLFAHSRRNFLWKGFLQVALASGEDASAIALLATFSGGVAP